MTSENIQENDIEVPDFNSEFILDIPTDQVQTPSSAPEIFFDELKARGIVEGEFDGSWEKLDNIIADMPNKAYTKFINSLPEDTRAVFEFARAAGDNITKEELRNFFMDYFEESETKELTFDEARQTLKEIYEKRGMKPRAIEAQLDDMEEEGDLLKEAQKELEAKKGKTTDAIARKKQEAETREANMKLFVQNVETEIESLDWKPDRKKKVIDILAKDTLRTNLQEIVSSPKGLIHLADILSYYNKKTNTFDLSKFSDQAESTAVERLKEKLSQASFGTGGSASTPSKQQVKLTPVFNL